MKTRSAAIPQDADKFILRLPAGLRDQLRTQAMKNYRSMNAEAVVLLERGLKAEAKSEAA